MIGLTAGRAIAFILAGWFGLLLVSSCQVMLPSLGTTMPVPAPDVLLLLVLFVGLSSRGGPSGVCALACVLGYLADLHAGSPKGMHMIAYAGLGLAARAASAGLMVRGGIFTAVVAALFTSCFGVFMVCLRVLIGSSGSGAWGVMRRVPLEVLTTALLAPIAFAVFRRIDRWFVRDPRVLARTP